MYDRPGRAQTAQDGRGAGGAVYLPSRGIKRAHGACGGSQGYAASRVCGSAADRRRIVPGMRAAVNPLEAAGCGYGAVGLCEALCGAFIPRAV